MSAIDPKKVHLSEEGSQDSDNGDVLLAQVDWTVEEEKKAKRKYVFRPDDLTPRN